MKRTLWNNIVEVVISALLCMPAGLIPSVSAAVNGDTLAPKSTYSGKAAGQRSPPSPMQPLLPPEKKKVYPAKPLREDLTDEEIRILNIYDRLEHINMSLYTGSLARANVRRQREAIEKRIKNGEKGLANGLKECLDTEAIWTKQINSYLEEIKLLQSDFPPPAQGESVLRTDARNFISRAVQFIEKNSIAPADVLLASAKLKMLAEFHALLDEHLDSIPRVRAKEIMSRTRFGQNVQTITMGGFGMRINRDGKLSSPLRHYAKDSQSDIYVLKWSRDKIDSLPAAVRQKIHIQENEYEEFLKITDSMKTLVDIRAQIMNAEEGINEAQQVTISHVLVTLILRLNPFCFKKLVTVQANQLERAIKPVLSQLKIRGNRRKAFLRKSIDLFRQLQTELSTTEELILERDKRAAKIKEFETIWEKLLEEEIAALGIQVDTETLKDVNAQWLQALNTHAVYNIGELISRLDPYGKIKDPYKRQALLNFRLAAQLVSSGRLDRNVPDFLDTAQSYLYKRVENTKRIRSAVERQEAALMAEVDRLSKRDEDIEKALKLIESKLLNDYDDMGACQTAIALANKHFEREANEPGMIRARRKLDAIIALLPGFSDAADELKKTEGLLDAKRDEYRRLAAEKRRLKREKAAIDAAYWYRRANEEYKALYASVERQLQEMVDEAAKDGLRTAGFQTLKNELSKIKKAVQVPKEWAGGQAGDLRVFGSIKIPQLLASDFIAKIQNPALHRKYSLMLRKIRRDILDARKIVEQYIGFAKTRTDEQAKETAERYNKIEQDLQIIDKRLQQSLKEGQDLRERHCKLKEDYNADVESRILSNIRGMHNDVLHKYEENVPPKETKHAYFDSSRLRELSGRLKERGIAEDKIRRFLYLIEKLKGPARLEGGEILTETYLLKLDEAISRLSGESEKSFFRLAREVLYHELAHEFLASGDGLRMLNDKVLTYPGFEQLKLQMMTAFPTIVADDLDDSRIAQEAVAKLASLVFEGEGATSVMSPVLREQLLKLKDHILKDKAFRTLTADGTEAMGDEHAQKTVFYMLKALLGRKYESLTNRSPAYLAVEAKNELATMQGEIDALVKEFTDAMLTVPSAAPQTGNANTLGVKESQVYP